MRSPAVRQLPSRRLALGVLSIAVALLGGCASLPSSGPTGQQIARGGSDTKAAAQFRIVELDSVAAVPAAAMRPAVFQPDYTPPPTDLIGAGDELEIAIYEAGVALFGGGGKVIGMSPVGADPSSQVERFPILRVDDSGYIRLPYAGRVRAAGSTTAELAQTIRRAYRGMSQDPQVLVSLRESINNSVIIGGEVARPGRLVLSTNRETVSDVIALAGGYRGDAKDLTVRIDRQGTFSDCRLSDLLTGEVGMRIFPGDKLSLVRAPRTFSVMGAPGRVEQMPFSGPSLSLAEALALAGGANPNIGDPAAVFVFRFERKGEKDEPVVYHVNMMKAGGYFVAQRFMMTDKDVLYIGNARANQPSKLVQIISQLFSPIVSITSLNNSLKN